MLFKVRASALHLTQRGFKISRAVLTQDARRPRIGAAEPFGDAPRSTHRGRQHGGPVQKANAMNKSTITTSVLGFAVVAALLTGCSAPAADLIPATPAKTAAAVEPTEAPAEAPAAAATKTGDVVDAAQAKVILKAGEGQRGYPMADGTFVVVTKTEPLPAAVQAEADAKSAATLTPFVDILADEAGADAALGAAQLFIAKNTGKRVIIAWQALGYATSYDEVKTMKWSISGGPAAGVLLDDEAAARAAIDSFLAGRDNGSEYAVVYVR